MRDFLCCVNDIPCWVVVIVVVIILVGGSYWKDCMIFSLFLFPLLSPFALTSMGIWFLSISTSNYFTDTLPSSLTSSFSKKYTTSYDVIDGLTTRINSSKFLNINYVRSSKPICYINFLKSMFYMLIQNRISDIIIFSLFSNWLLRLEYFVKFDEKIGWMKRSSHDILSH